MKGPSSSSCCSSELRWLGSLPRVAAGAHCQLMAVPFLLIWCPGASPPSFLGQNSFWQIFFSCLMSMEELWKLLQIEFCSSITVKAASQQTCWMSLLTGLEVTDLSCHVRPQGKWGGRDPPSHSHCVGKGVVHWLGSQDFCMPSDLYQSKPRTDVLWAATVILLRNPLKNWTRSFLEDLASSVKPLFGQN